MKCIYCLEEIQEEGGRSKEHVFPQSFGCPDIWVIWCVCKPCNSERFGGTIDRWLACDSVETRQRLQRVGSRSKNFKSGTRRVRVSDDKGKCGNFAGVIIDFDYSRPGYILFPPQAGFLNEVTGKKYFFTQNSFENKNILKEIRSLSKKNFTILAPSAVEHKDVVSDLLRLKIIDVYKETEAFGFPEALLNEGKILATILIDPPILRAVAKIAFNFLAFIRGYEVAIRFNFDEIRNYITEGTQSRELVFPSLNPILADETRGGRYFDGHIFVIEQTFENEIRAKITLFNIITYEVVLSNNSGDCVYNRFRKGYAFYVEESRFEELLPTDLIKF